MYGERRRQSAQREIDRFPERIEFLHDPPMLDPLEGLKHLAR